MADGISYEKAGVDIDTADATKRQMAKSLDDCDARVLNKLGAFASLFDARFEGYEHPVLVLKTEEPGSKQKLALANGRAESICYDLVNHLINDIIVMGARPMAVQDAIICGKLEKDVVLRMVGAIAQACRDQDCTLTGGETSEQPGVLERGIYVLTASIVGLVEKAAIIDGSAIAEGDVVLAVASNGLHTNGYSLVRALLAEDPGLANTDVAGQSFLEAVLLPHMCYYQALKGLMSLAGLHGLAHITGGGMKGNLNRVLPEGLDAAVDISRLRIPPIFNAIAKAARIDDAEMLKTFNMGVGMAIVVSPGAVEEVIGHLGRHDCQCYPIGEIVPGAKAVTYRGQLDWSGDGPGAVRPRCPHSPER